MHVYNVQICTLSKQKWAYKLPLLHLTHIVGVLGVVMPKIMALACNWYTKAP
jgi:hypothetical protein